MQNKLLPSHTAANDNNATLRSNISEFCQTKCELSSNRDIKHLHSFFFLSYSPRLTNTFLLSVSIMQWVGFFFLQICLVWNIRQKRREKKLHYFRLSTRSRLCSKKFQWHNLVHFNYTPVKTFSINYKVVKTMCLLLKAFKIKINNHGQLLNVSQLSFDNGKQLEHLCACMTNLMGEWQKCTIKRIMTKDNEAGQKRS